MLNQLFIGLLDSLQFWRKVAFWVLAFEVKLVRLYVGHLGLNRKR